jgi:hypothetical protein
VLELEPGTEPISGSIGHESGPARSFAGLMQLVAALDDLRADGSADGVLPAALAFEEEGS